jgi:hypothetical protein
MLSGLPIHVPFDVVNVEPTRALPEITGRTVYPSTATLPRPAVVTDALPRVVDAVTVTVMTAPISELVKTYDGAFAPVIAEEEPPKLLFHWYVYEVW